MAKVIFLTGPTGIGKTEGSLLLAKALDTDILCIDSMQIYKGLNIGTAKPTPEEQAEVPHSLHSYVDPRERYSVGAYQKEAYRAIKERDEKGKISLFVGGTGLYVDAVKNQFNFRDVEPNPKLRKRLEAEYETSPEDFLERAKEVDPEGARSLNPKDKKKLLRLMEVYEETGEVPSEREDQEDIRDLDFLQFVLDMDREDLYDRINKRVDLMLEAGLVEEVKGLLEADVPPDAQAMLAIGYREVVWHLQGLITKEEMVRLLKRNTRKYAKRQMTWFRRDKTNIVIEKDHKTNEEWTAEIMQILRDRGFLNGTV